MRTLKDFLLAEAKKGPEMPQGFTKFNLVGSLTDIAQQAIGSSSIRAVLADKSKTGKVAAELKIQTRGDKAKAKPSQVMNEIINGKSAFSELFVSNSLQPEGDKGFRVKMVTEWKDLAGTQRSSEKLVYFYMKSSMLAAGVDTKSNNDKQVSYGINASTSEIIVFLNN